MEKFQDSPFNKCVELKLILTNAVAKSPWSIPYNAWILAGLPYQSRRVLFISFSCCSSDQGSHLHLYKLLSGSWQKLMISLRVLMIPIHPCPALTSRSQYLERKIDNRTVEVDESISRNACSRSAFAKAKVLMNVCSLLISNSSE